MNKGFILCGVVCAALALAIIAGLYEWFGASAVVAVFILLGVFLLFHAAAIFMLGPRSKASSARPPSGEGAPLTEGPLGPNGNGKASPSFDPLAPEGAAGDPLAPEEAAGPALRGKR